MNVSEMDEKQLREAAKKLEVKCPPNMGVEARKKVEEEVAVAQYKKELEFKEKAMAQRKKDVAEMLNLDPQTKAKPAPETVAIANSKKVYAVYRNLTEDKGTDIEFRRGPLHLFHLYDRYLHVLPMCLIEEAEDPDCPIGKTPIHGLRRDPKLPAGVAGEVSQIIGYESRFDYVVKGDAPDGAPFGVVLDKDIYKKFHHPFPQVVRKDMK